MGSCRGDACDGVVLAAYVAGLGSGVTNLYEGRGIDIATASEPVVVEQAVQFVLGGTNWGIGLKERPVRFRSA